MNFEVYKYFLKQLKGGKRLPDALYLELAYFKTAAHDHLLDFYGQILFSIGNDIPHNVIKLFTSQFKLSLLQYKSFWDTPHPELEVSTHIDLSTGKMRQFNYRNSSNPPILHRKENLIDPEHPEINKYLALTQAEEQAGLYANPRTIGFKKNWETLLHSKRLFYLRQAKSETSGKESPTPRNLLLLPSGCKSHQIKA